MDRQNRPKIVITGMGAVTPNGMGLANYWDGLANGRGGAVAIDWFDTEDLPSKVAAPCNGYIPDDHFDKKEQRRNARFVQLAIVAAREAMKDSGLDMEKENPWRVGSFVGCGIGGIDFMEEQILLMARSGAKRISPLLIPKIIPNMASGCVGIDLGLKGPNLSVASACASSGHALGESLRALQRGEADVMISGGTEAALCKVALAGFGNMGAVSKRNDDPATASRPFDAERDGFVMGEGAAMLVLETEEHAKARGARIYGELAGYGATDDAYHITSPDEDGTGGAEAMRLALDDAGLNPSDVQYVNAHGTSTPINDRVETQAIKSVFNSHAKSLAVSSTKSMVGHLLGAAAAVEAVASVLTIYHGVIAPTINYQNPDADCDLDYVPNTARESRVNAAISNSLGFGGHNATLAFRRYGG